MGLSDKFNDKYGTQDELFNLYGLNTKFGKKILE